MYAIVFSPDAKNDLAQLKKSEPTHFNIQKNTE